MYGEGGPIGSCLLEDVHYPEGQSIRSNFFVLSHITNKKMNNHQYV